MIDFRKTETGNFVASARNAFEAGYLHDSEYISLLRINRALQETSELQDRWLTEIANRIGSGIPLRKRQSLRDRELRTLNVIDAAGNTKQLTSFDIVGDMARGDLVDARSKMGKKRLQSRKSVDKVR